MATPINKVTGIGAKTAEYLKQFDITTAELLISHGLEKLAQAPGFGKTRAADVIKAAKALISGAGGKAKSEKKPKPQKKDKKGKAKSGKGKKNKDKKKDKKSKKGKGKKNKK